MAFSSLRPILSHGVIVSTSNRGVFAGGYAASDRTNSIDYIDISSTGNASDFGDLSVTRNSLGACSNGTTDRGIFGGGTTGSNSNVIDYITISTTGDATDFGDLTFSNASDGKARTPSGCSDNNGGLL